MGAAHPRVFTIPAGIDFARALCEGVIERCGRDPLSLSDALLLVPTRRAARSLREAFAEALGGAALIPRIRALGDVDDEELTFDPGEDVFAAGDLAAAATASARDIGAALGRRPREPPALRAGDDACGRARTFPR